MFFECDQKIRETKGIALYATNENETDYYYETADIYDINNNLNTTEQVNYKTTSISMISANSLLTNQIASNYDDKGSMVISPKIVELKPIYAVVDQEQQEEQKQPQEPDSTTTNKEIPSAGLTKEQIAIIVVTVMSVITVVLTVIAIKGTILSRKYKR